MTSTDDRKPVTIKWRWWEVSPSNPKPERVVYLRPTGSTEWARETYREVSLEDGTVIGEVHRYKGSIDTKIKGTRLRHQGVTRTLWAAYLPGNGRGMFEFVSRADAIRHLLDRHERRNQ